MSSQGGTWLKKRGFTLQGTRGRGSLSAKKRGFNTRQRERCYRVYTEAPGCRPGPARGYNERDATTCKRRHLAVALAPVGSTCGGHQPCRGGGGGGSAAAAGVGVLLRHLLRALPLFRALPLLR